MFSVRQKREISDAVQKILRATAHSELPEGEISFYLHVKGATSISWADILNNEAVKCPSVNLHNEAQDIGANNLPLKPSDAILAGCKIAKRKCKSHYFIYPDEANLIGAMALGCGFKRNDTNYDIHAHSEIINFLVGIFGERILDPFKTGYRCNGHEKVYGREFNQVIQKAVSRNSQTDESRESIAAWLKEQGL